MKYKILESIRHGKESAIQMFKQEIFGEFVHNLQEIKHFMALEPQKAYKLLNELIKDLKE